jgi:phospholipid/cholesterol/gamma-HCH transport system substrate-binding protein
MAETKYNNVKLGLLVLGGLVLLISTLYYIGKNENLFGSNFQLRTRFANANGLLAGNNVRFSGMQAGTVKSVRVINDTTIEAILLIDNTMRPYINKNAETSIGTEGLIGNKIINIIPSKIPASLPAPGDLLPSQQQINTDQMLQTLSRTNNNIALISEELITTVQRINSSAGLWGVLNDNSLPRSLKSSLENIRRASANANDLVSDLHILISDVKSGKGTIGNLLLDTMLAHNLGQAVAKIDAAGDKTGALLDELHGMVADIHENVSTGKGTVNSLLKDTVLAARLSASMENIRKGTDAFNLDMEALKHNFLLRGYFRKQEKALKKQKKN